MSEITLAHIDWKSRCRLHLLTASAVLFLSFYGKVVCPFIDTLSFTRIVTGLSVVWLFQILIREWFYRRFPVPIRAVTLARHGFYLSVLTWIISGVAASALHGLLYSEFHWSSHLKLMSGYWGLGAGILSQLEYVLLEEKIRRIQTTSTTTVLEKIARRQMEGYFLFTLIPVMVMVLMSFRFVYEGYTDRNAALEVLFIGICFLVASLLVSWRYGRALKQDCIHLLEALEAVGRGEYQLTVDASRGDELGRVAGGIHEMAQGLLLRERIRDAFGRFVNPQVAEAFIHTYGDGKKSVQMGGQYRTVAVLMADIRDFTPLSERLEPEALTTLLNSYFQVMVAAIQQHGGMVDKFIGDAVMAVFGLSEGQSNPATDAVRAALAMREGLQQLNQSFVDRQCSNQLDNGIGIHFGEVIAGYIGSQDRLEFTVIGHTVNIAARIESQTKPPNPPILFSDTVAEQLGSDFNVVKVSTVALKGISQQMALFTVKH
ncbi:MAG: adenylate/guanylate cyclase domain-containing protein [Magnetococcales bacterium]|nr:adenylate/guanylate cyclase domain-containing protein [Magnetococcales bacterium]